MAENILDIATQTSSDDTLAQNVVNVASASTANVEAIAGAPVSPMFLYRRAETVVRDHAKVGRNEPCPCGSGKKYKHCCLSTGEYETTHTLHTKNY